MSSPFESSINSKRQSYFSGLRPSFADLEFWSDVLMTPSDAISPGEFYSLITSSGDGFTDNSSNPLIAFTVLSGPTTINPPDVLYSLITSSSDRMVDSSSNPLIAVT